MGRRELVLVSVGAGPSVVLVCLIAVALAVPDLQRLARYLTFLALVSAIAFPALINVLSMRNSSRSSIDPSRCS